MQTPAIKKEEYTNEWTPSSCRQVSPKIATAVRKKVDNQNSFSPGFSRPWAALPGPWSTLRLWSKVPCSGPSWLCPGNLSSSVAACLQKEEVGSVVVLTLSIPHTGCRHGASGSKAVALSVQCFTQPQVQAHGYPALHLQLTSSSAGLCGTSFREA